MIRSSSRILKGKCDILTNWNVVKRKKLLESELLCGEEETMFFLGEVLISGDLIVFGEAVVLQGDSYDSL